ncbi:MAG: M15 family metallopeptidase [Oscillospiraceae bacterium]|nr:M15 family metallopeptidase [Oscillospiraceae bacterium]
MADYRSTGKELRKSPKGIIALGILVAIGIVGAYFGTRVWGNIRPIVNTDPLPQQTDDTEIIIPTETTAPPTDQTVFSYQAFFGSDFDASKGFLVLVNREFAITDIQEGLVSVYSYRNEHFGVSSTDVKLLETPAQKLAEMMDGFYQATGHEDIQIIDGYRTEAKQKSLYDKATVNNTETNTAAAGHSDHETGLSFDLNIYSDGTITEFDGSGDYAWLVEHCAEYGFIQRYPADKTELTGFEAEPWHFRYVGAEHAQYMKENNLCLEEYLAILKNYTYDGEKLSLSANGNKYAAFYVPIINVDDAGIFEIPIPADTDYSLSGDNQNGVIVTYLTKETETTAVTE